MSWSNIYELYEIFFTGKYSTLLRRIPFDNKYSKHKIYCTLIDFSDYKST